MRGRRRFLVGGLAILLPAPLWAFDVLVYVVKNGHTTGPFDAPGLAGHIRSKAEAARILVWHEGMPDWSPAAQVPALAAFVENLPEQTPFDPKAFFTWGMG